jgi:hypothetical protein
MVARMQIELFEGRQSCGQRSARWFGVILHGWWRLYFVRREGLTISVGFSMTQGGGGCESREGCSAIGVLESFQSCF